MRTRERALQARSVTRARVSSRVPPSRPPRRDIHSLFTASKYKNIKIEMTLFHWMLTIAPVVNYFDWYFEQKCVRDALGIRHCCCKQRASSASASRVVNKNTRERPQIFCFSPSTTYFTIYFLYFTSDTSYRNNKSIHVVLTLAVHFFEHGAGGGEGCEEKGSSPPPLPRPKMA